MSLLPRFRSKSSTFLHPSANFDRSSLRSKTHWCIASGLLPCCLFGNGLRTFGLSQRRCRCPGHLSIHLPTSLSRHPNSSSSLRLRHGACHFSSTRDKYQLLGKFAFQFRASSCLTKSQYRRQPGLRGSQAHRCRFLNHRAPI